MGLDDEFDEKHDDALEYEDYEYEIQGSDDDMGRDTLSEFDPLNITDPKSDDAQDELEGDDRIRMRCLSCGHRFYGEMDDDCPK